MLVNLHKIENSKFLKKRGPGQVHKNAGVGAMGKVQVQMKGDSDSPKAFLGRIVLSQELANYAGQMRQVLPHPLSPQHTHTYFCIAHNPGMAITFFNGWIKFLRLFCDI